MDFTLGRPLRGGIRHAKRFPFCSSLDLEIGDWSALLVDEKGVWEDISERGRFSGPRLREVFLGQGPWE